MERRLSYIIPSWDMQVKKREQYRRALVDELRYRMIERFVVSNPVIRNLQYGDLGLQSWHTPKQDANEKTVWVSEDVPDCQVVAIYGLAQLSPYPKVYSMRLGTGSDSMELAGWSNIYADMGISELYSLLPVLRRLDEMNQGWLETTFGSPYNMRMEAYFTKPCCWEAGEKMRILVESSVDNLTGDEIALLGFVAEPLGVRVS
jgi:hypothetical protein